MTDMELAEEIERRATYIRYGMQVNREECEQIIAALRRGHEPLQDRVAPWMQACFGPEISSDKTERNHRFVEESLELAQANGCTMSEAHQLVDYVFHRPAGDAHQECGGVLITLAALCLARGLNMEKAGEDELARIWKKIDVIRKKQAAKPPHSPLPERPPSGEMVIVPKLETEAMQDSVRGILQAIRCNPGVTEDQVYQHCKLRGDSTKGLHENDGSYVTEARAAAMIYRAMIAAAEAEGRKS